MGTKANPGKYDCHANALPDEPMFVLLARDPDFERLVRSWAESHQRAIFCGDRPDGDFEIVNEAMQCALDGARWRKENLGKWRKPVEAARPMSDVTEFHPIQTHDVAQRGAGFVPAAVALRAYEVYCALYGEQPAMVDLAGRNCRGGFDVGELVAFLYARSFPKEQWRTRFEEALQRPEPQR